MQLKSENLHGCPSCRLRLADRCLSHIGNVQCDDSAAGWLLQIIIKGSAPPRNKTVLFHINHSHLYIETSCHRHKRTPGVIHSNSSSHHPTSPSKHNVSRLVHQQLRRQRQQPGHQHAIIRCGRERVQQHDHSSGQ